MCFYSPLTPDQMHKWLNNLSMQSQAQSQAWIRYLHTLHHQHTVAVSALTETCSESPPAYQADITHSHNQREASVRVLCLRPCFTLYGPPTGLTDMRVKTVAGHSEHLAGCCRLPSDFNSSHAPTATVSTLFAKLAELADDRPLFFAQWRAQLARNCLLLLPNIAVCPGTGTDSGWLAVALCPIASTHSMAPSTCQVTGTGTYNIATSIRQMADTGSMQLITWSPPCVKWLEQVACNWSPPRAKWLVQVACNWPR